MILIFLFAFCDALKWSTTGETFNKLERKRAKLSRDTKKYLDNNSRTGNSLCSLRETDNQCCNGASLNCYGCNPVLLELGVPCENQESANRFSNVNSTLEQRRDCFCDDLCITFEDCCDDHREVCSHLFLTYKGNNLLDLYLTTRTRLPRKNPTCARTLCEDEGRLHSSV